MKLEFTKSLKKLSVLIIIAIAITGCNRHEHHEQGPRGYDGAAFFGVDYSTFTPYSYGDNNPSVPNNPVLGHYYLSYPGSFDFEYFVNPFEYWYGTYDLWVNYGGPGGQFGEPGLNGLDTYLMLICDPQGFYEERTFGKSNTTDMDQEIEINSNGVTIKMKKTNVTDREPKLTVKFTK